MPSFLQLSSVAVAQNHAFNEEGTSGGGEEISRAITDTDALLLEMGAMVIKHQGSTLWKKYVFHL